MCPQRELWLLWRTHRAFAWGLQGITSTLIVITSVVTFKLLLLPLSPSVRTQAGSCGSGLCVFVSLLLSQDPTLHTKCSSRLAGSTRCISSQNFLLSRMWLEPAGKKKKRRKRLLSNSVCGVGSIYISGRNWCMVLLGECWSNPRDHYWLLVRHMTVPVDLNRQGWFSCFDFFGWKKTSGKKFFNLLYCVTQKSSLVLLTFLWDSLICFHQEASQNPT